MNEEQVLRDASRVQAGLALTIQSMHKCLEQASTALHDYYKSAPKEELSARIAETYHSFDSNKDGVMQIGELEEALAEMGMRPTKEELQHLFQEYDADQNGTIELDEYEHMVRISLNVTHQCPCRQCKAARKKQAAERKLSSASAASATNEHSHGSHHHVVAEV